jgi:hypothetical protein
MSKGIVSNVSGAVVEYGQAVAVAIPGCINQNGIVIVRYKVA